MTQHNPIPKKKSGVPAKMPDEEILLALYQNHTSREIAGLYNVSESTVRSWVHKIRYRGDKNEL